MFYGAQRQIFVVPSEGGTAVRLTAGTGSGVNPRWSPNGLQIAFNPGGLGPRELRFIARDHVGGPWREPVRLTNVSCQLQAWAPDGSGVLCTDYRSTLTVVSPTRRVLWRRDLLATYRLRLQGYGSAYSRDRATIYVTAAREDGRRGIWGIPVGAGLPRLVVSSDDAALSLFGTLSAGPSRLYTTVSQYESDVWAMRLRF